MNSIMSPVVQSSPYPCLKITNDPELKTEIVMFTESKVGFVVYSQDPSRVGRYRRDWLESSFSKFNGEILLSN